MSNILTNYWWRQLHFNPPKQTCRWAVAPPYPYYSAPMRITYVRNTSRLSSFTSVLAETGRYFSDGTQVYSVMRHW